MAGYGGQRSRSAKVAAIHEKIREPSPVCTKCEEQHAQHEEVLEKYHKELEHLRRGLSKMLESAKVFMPASHLRTLQESLQLDVRFLSAPKEGEGGPLPPLPAVEDQFALIEQLRAKIASQALKIDEFREDNQFLREELKRALDALKKAGVQFAASSGNRKLTEPPKSVEAQTDPWRPEGPKGTHDDSLGVIDEATSKKKKGGPKDSETNEGKRPRRPGHSSSDSDEEIDPATGQTVVKKGGRGGRGYGDEGTAGTNSGIDPDEHKRLLAELELLRMKVSAMEKQLKQLDVLKAEIERLNKLLADKDALIDSLRSQISKLQALLDAGGDAPAAAAVGPGRRKSSKEEETKKKGKKAAGAVDIQGGKKGTVLKPDAEKGPKRKVVSEDGKEIEVVIEEDDADDEDSEDEKNVVMEDKCVGNGPGKGMQDEPIRARGRGLFKDVEDLNKLGRCYDRYLVSQPELGLGNSGGMATTSPEGALSRGLLSRSSKSRGVPVGTMGGVQYASSWLSKSTGALYKRSETWQDAEPYLEQVWEHNPKGHRLPVRRELVQLGALSPQKNDNDRMAQTLPSLKSSPESSPVSGRHAFAQRPPATAGPALGRTQKVPP